MVPKSDVIAIHSAALRGIILKKYSSPPRSVETPTLQASDQLRTTKVKIHRVLIGYEAVRQGKVHRHQYDSNLAAGKQLVYFEVTVELTWFSKYLGGGNPQAIYSADFTLVDNEGLTYSYVVTKDNIFGTEIHAERSVRGGVAFAIYFDSIPSVLLFKTPFSSRVTGKRQYVNLDLGLPSLMDAWKGLKDR